MSTLYRPVHKSGATSLPHGSMTAAALWIQQQGTPADWRIEPIADPIVTPSPRDATPLERKHLVAYLTDLMNGQDEAEAIAEAQEARICVFDHYVSDSPGYRGPVMVVVYSGGPNVHECYIWDNGQLKRVESQHETDAEPDFNTPNPSEENAHLMQSVIELQRENIIYRLALETIAEAGASAGTAQGIAQEVTRHHPPRPYPLADFGRSVLEILERETDWGSETMDDISAEAMRRGLAVEQNGFFKASAAAASHAGKMIV